MQWSGASSSAMASPPTTSARAAAARRRRPRRPRRRPPTHSPISPTMTTTKKIMKTTRTPDAIANTTNPPAAGRRAHGRGDRRRGGAPARTLPSVGEGGRDSAARVFLRQGRSRPLWFGHPWVYENAIDRVEGEAGPGDVVSLTDHDGRLIGRGFYNPRSQIPVRLCTRGDAPVDAAFFRARIAAARALRARLALPSAATTIYRLVNSEGDDLPGLVVDVFGDAAVAQITTLGIAQRKAEIYDALEAELGVQTIFESSPAG